MVAWYVVYRRVNLLYLERSSLAKGNLRWSQVENER